MKALSSQGASWRRQGATCTSCTRRVFTVTTTILWNNLPSDVVQSPLPEVFRVLNYLIQAPFPTKGWTRRYDSLWSLPTWPGLRFCDSISSPLIHHAIYSQWQKRASRQLEKDIPLPTPFRGSIDPPVMRQCEGWWAAPIKELNPPFDRSPC